MSSLLKRFLIFSLHQSKICYQAESPLNQQDNERCTVLMTNLIEQLSSNHPEWQQLSAKLNNAVTLNSIVLTACKMGTWLARAIVQQQLSERAQLHKQWSFCSSCGTRLVSKGFVKRRMLTLVGEVEWKRRVGRCPRHCHGSHRTEFDEVLEIQAYQQTLTELVRLGCLLAVFLPFNLSFPVVIAIDWHCR